MASILYRRGRSCLLLAVLAMATGLITALLTVSAVMEKRVAAEVRNYGANLVVMPAAARLDVGSGGFRFGVIDEPAYLKQNELTRVLEGNKRIIADYSLHLSGFLKSGPTEIPVEGVVFDQVRRLFPWWQLKGNWPAAHEGVAGADLAARFGWRPGDAVALEGASSAGRIRLVGIVSTGGDEDGELFLALGELQELLALPGQVSQARLMADAGKVTEAAGHLQGELPRVAVREVRQVARTSEALLRKVQLLMLLVTAVVVIACGGSVGSTLSATVLERGKEIGLMKAMGGVKREVMFVFAAEAALLGAAGGILGYLAGSAIASLIVTTVFTAPAEASLAFLPISVGAGITLALLAGI